MFCPKCGKEIYNNVLFCSECNCTTPNYIKTSDNKKNKVKKNKQKNKKMQKI